MVPGQRMLDQVFTQTKYVHLLFLGANLVYVACGEVIRWSRSPFQGFGAQWIQDNEMLIRVGFWIVVAVQVTLVVAMYNRRSYQEAIISRRKARGADDGSATAVALQAIQILKATPAAVAGVMGLVLFTLDGERLDLYTFAAFSVAALLVTLPRRSAWRRTLERSVAIPP